MFKIILFVIGSLFLLFRIYLWTARQIQRAKDLQAMMFGKTTQSKKVGNVEVKFKKPSPNKKNTPNTSEYTEFEEL